MPLGPPGDAVDEEAIQFFTTPGRNGLGRHYSQEPPPLPTELVKVVI